ncbi:tetratricopeptide repeat protein [Frankia sp. RB7]|nr:tetratricopeptide repeat protein [Frankia sp. RB7]
MGASEAPLLQVHGRLWYDDRWYRVAWIIWPQAIALLVFVLFWVAPLPKKIDPPWAKPVVQNPPVSGLVDNLKPEYRPPPLAQPADPLAPCRGKDYGRIVQACGEVINSSDLSSGDRALALAMRGWAYYSTKQHEQALGDYERSIALAPQNYGTYNDRGVVWLAVPNYDRAMQDFDRAILIKPDYGLGYQNRGETLRLMKRPNEALVALSTAINLDSKLWRAYELRAFTFEDQSNWRAVYDDANKLIELAPNYRMGYELRGHAYLEAGQYQPAIVDFTKVISLDSSSIYGWRMRGRANYFLNQFDAAASDFEAALRINPRDGTTIGFINDLSRRRAR